MTHTAEDQERGFSIAELLMAAVIIILVAAVGFLIYQNRKPKAAAVSTVVTATPTTCTTRPNTWSADATDTATAAALTSGKQPKSVCLYIDDGTTTINSALYASRFGNSATNGAGAVVDVTIKNTTSSIQNYDLNHFSVQFPRGKIVKADTIYSSTDSAGQLRPLTLAAGGSTEEVFMTAGASSAAVAGTGSLVYTSPATHKTVEAPLAFGAAYN